MIISLEIPHYVPINRDSIRNDSIIYRKEPHHLLILITLYFFPYFYCCKSKNAKNTITDPASGPGNLRL